MKKYALLFFLAVTLLSCKTNDWIDWKVENEVWMQAPELDARYSSIEVHETASGLKYQVLYQGNTTDTKPSIGSKVLVDYSLHLINGSEVQTGNNVEFTVVRSGDNQYVTGLIDGFVEGLKKMNVGGDYVFFIPWQLAYGKDGNQALETGNAFIPPYSALIYEVHLTAVYK